MIPTTDPMLPNDNVQFQANVFDSGIVRLETGSGRTSYGTVQNLFDVLREFCTDSASYKYTLIGDPATTGVGGLLHGYTVVQCKVFPAEIREIWARPLRQGQDFTARWGNVVTEVKFDVNEDMLVKLRVEVPKQLWVWKLDTRMSSYPNIPFVATKVFTYKKTRRFGIKCGWLSMGNTFPSDGHICWPDAYLRLATHSIESVRELFLGSVFNSDTNPPRTKWLGRYNPPNVLGQEGNYYIGGAAFRRSYQHGTPLDILKKEIR